MYDLKTTTLRVFAFIMFAAMTITVSATSNKKVLMVVSSYGEQQGEKTPGYEFDEFAKAYMVFKANGISVDVASPKGGAVEADKYDSKKPYNANVLNDKTIMKKIGNTLATRTVDARDYDGVFIVGGKGAMFDLPKDTALQSFIAKLYQQQGSVAAVCHGPAALVDVTLSDGSYLVANKRVNGFTNQEEKLFGKKWMAQFDFMLEDKLIERGGKFQSSEMMLSHVAVDERLITGQNPTSTTAVAQALVKSLGLTLVIEEQGQEEKTLALVAQVLAGDKSAIDTLTRDHAQYSISLVGMYGFYYLKIAETQLQLEHALALMSVAKGTINNPMLDIKIAATQHKLGRNQAAKKTLEQILATKPDHQGAIDMMKTLSL